MKPPMNQTCTIYDVTVDKFNDQIVAGTQDYPCKFRYGDELTRGSNQENIDSSGMAWFNPDTPLEEGTIFATDGQFYRVARLIKARRINSPTALFLKVFVDKYHEMESAVS